MSKIFTHALNFVFVLQSYLEKKKKKYCKSHEWCLILSKLYSNY